MQRHRNQSNGFRSNGPVYRNYNNRGGGGGGGYRGPPPPRRIDVFMEAGRLATQYLLAKGLLNNNNKGQNNYTTNNDVNDVKSPVVVSDLRDESKVVRRTVKDPRIELSNNEISKNLEKIGEGDEAVLGGEEVKPVVSGDLELRNVETKVENEEKELRDEDVGVEAPVLEVTKMEGVESEEKIDDVKNVYVKTEDDVMMDDGDIKDEKTVVEEDVMEENENDNGNGNGNGNGKDSGSDLLTLIRDDNVPTRTRSSLTLKGSKSDPVLISGDESKTKEQNLEEAKREPEPEQLLEMKHEPKVKQVTSDEDDMYKFGLGLHMRSQSFPQRSVSELGLGDGHQEYSRSSSDVLSRGEKRPLEINDFTDISKKHRDWASASPPPHNYFNLSSSRGDQSSSHEGGSYAEEKQLFPNSFKICDLNLTGGSEANENRDTKSAIGFLPQAKQEPVSVDFDLTMNNSCGIVDRHVRRGIDGKGVEVIDLDCDSVQDGNNNSDRRDEAIFTDLESFPDNIQRVSDLPQDGYGLMISELLDADIPNSSVSTGVNSMHNEMSLQNEEGILGDDDSIYMSLGEIPISFVPVWDQQPSQRYDKRY